MTQAGSIAAVKPSTESRPFGVRDKFSYAMGDFGCNMSFALNSYLMLFYTQYIGLSMQMWGVIILVLKIWDAINDPIMGGLMDTLKPGKRGKFKTYIFYGSFVLAISGALCFLPIPTAPMGIKILACVLGYLVWDMAFTVVNVPYGAMNAVISADSGERAQLSTWRTLGGLVATMLVMVILPVFCYDRNNNLLGKRIFVIALILGVIGFIAIQILLKGTTERVESHQKTSDKKYNYLQALKGFFTNRAAVGITLASMMTLLVSSGLTSANQILYQVFFKNAQISGVIGLLSIIPMLALAPAVKPLVNKFGKREAASYPLLLGMAATLCMVLLPIQPDGSGLIIWVVLSILASIASTVFNMVGWAMVADCIDYQELKTGMREEGTVYATYSLGRKLAQGFGASLIAFLLILTGYNAVWGAQQPIYIANNIRIMIGLIQFICTALQFVFLRFMYNLDKKTVTEMEVKLGHKKAES